MPAAELAWPPRPTGVKPPKQATPGNRMDLWQMLSEGRLHVSTCFLLPPLC